MAVAQDANIQQAIAGAAGANIRDLRAIAGFPDNSPLGAGWQRIYLRLDLTHYVDVLDADIAHHVVIANGANLLAGAVFWVNRDASIIESRVHDAGAFLQGDLTRIYLDPSVAIVGGRVEPAVDPPSLSRPC
jgi:hypothetical protein